MQLDRLPLALLPCQPVWLAETWASRRAGERDVDVNGFSDMALRDPYTGMLGESCCSLARVAWLQAGARECCFVGVDQRTCFVWKEGTHLAQGTAHSEVPESRTWRLSCDGDVVPQTCGVGTLEPLLFCMHGDDWCRGGLNQSQLVRGTHNSTERFVRSQHIALLTFWVYRGSEAQPHTWLSRS